MGGSKQGLDPTLAQALSRARAPFGRIGEKLGFRWIMPIGTLPLPFHPGLGRLLPFIVPALVLHRILLVATGGSGGVGWRGLFIAAACLAIPMSIPILSWLMMAFRAPLLQGLLIAGGMMLLALDATAGVAPAWTAAIPAAWLGLFIVQTVGGPMYLKRLQAMNAAFSPIAPGRRLVILEKDRIASDYGNWLFRHCDIARVAIEPDKSGRSLKQSERTLHRLRPEDRAYWAKKIGRIRPAGWSVGADHLVTSGIADPGYEPPIRVRARAHRAPFWLVGGGRTMLEVDDGETVRRLVGGEAALTRPIPLCVCFYWMALFGGRSQWVAGFVRGKPISLGTARVYDMFLRAFPALPEGGGESVDPAPFLTELDAIDREDTEAARMMLEALLALDERLPRYWNALVKRPDVLSGRGRELCACVAAARAAKRPDIVVKAAQFLALLPEDQFEGLSAELIALLNSKELAFRIVDDPAVLALPAHERDQHVVGGYSLVRHAPRLYERLAELGEPARWLIMALGELGRWPPPLAKARDHLDQRKVIRE